MTQNNPSYIGNLIPSVMNYQKKIDSYKKGIREGEFYEEPIGDDPFGCFYPDWQSLNRLVFTINFRQSHNIKVVKLN